MNALYCKSKKLWKMGMATTVAALFAMQVMAHHSFAMFDSQNQVKFTGTVARFDWTNPHVYIELDVAGTDGSSAHWTIECANISILSRLGWKFNFIKPGDEITVIVAPLRTGKPGALLKQVTLADGSIWGNGAPAGPPAEHLL